jgi:hypothetical protein
MQYPVPQFTDVEDKIIGSLSFKQFGILGAAGAFVFFVYSVTKSIPIALVAVVFVGGPAAFVAFFKLNGRPLYTNAAVVFRYLISPKTMVFDKQGLQNDWETSVQAATPAPETASKSPINSQLKNVAYQLQQQAAAERELTR